MTGASSSAIPPRSQPCSTDFSITATSSSAVLEAGERKRSYLAMRKTRNKERELFLIGFIALCQSRSFWFKPNGASCDTPLRSWPLSRRSGRFPALPYPPLRSVRILTANRIVVALVMNEGVENLVRNVVGQWPVLGGHQWPVLRWPPRPIQRVAPFERLAPSPTHNS